MSPGETNSGASNEWIRLDWLVISVLYRSIVADKSHLDILNVGKRREENENHLFHFEGEC